MPRPLAFVAAAVAAVSLATGARVMLPNAAEIDSSIPADGSTIATSVYTTVPACGQAYDAVYVRGSTIRPSAASPRPGTPARGTAPG